MHSSRMRTARYSPYTGLCLGVSLTEIPLDRDTPRRNMGPETETPWKEHGTRDRDPLEGTWDQRQKGVTYRDPSPREQNDRRV